MQRALCRTLNRTKTSIHAQFILDEVLSGDTVAPLLEALSRHQFVRRVP